VQLKTTRFKYLLFLHASRAFVFHVGNDGWVRIAQRLWKDIEASCWSNVVKCGNATQSNDVVCSSWHPWTNKEFICFKSQWLMQLTFAT
jgi:hypothetical protein